MRAVATVINGDTKFCQLPSTAICCSHIMDWQYWWDLIRILILGFWVALKEIDFFQWLLCRRDRQVHPLKKNEEF